MTSYLRKQIVMANYKANDPKTNFGYMAPDWLRSNHTPHTPYVRFWVDWEQLAPAGPNNPATDTSVIGSGGVTPKDYVAGLDAQIRYARSLDLKVMLTYFQFPSWSNGQASSVPEYHWYVPADLTVNGYWARYLWWVMTRWSVLNPNAGGAYADFLEICNEPNNQFRPRKDANGNYTAATFAGRMMVTAQQVARANAVTSPILVGPALQDTDGTVVAQEGPAFQRELVGYLKAVGFKADKYFAWSSHNYTDIKNRNTALAQTIRNTLKGWWTGWPDENAANPYVLHTEGGSREDDRVPPMQAGYANWHNDTEGRGAGLAMYSQYLDVTDPGYDTGLRKTTPAFGQPNPWEYRPVFSTWAALPAP